MPHRIGTKIRGFPTAPLQYFTAPWGAAAPRLKNTALRHPERLQPSSFINNPALLYSRRSVQSALDKFGRNSTEHIAAIATHEDLHRVLAEKTANEIIDEISLRTHQCKAAAAWKAINRLCCRKPKPLNCLAAKSIEDRKQQLVAHYRDLLNSSNTKAVIAPRNPRNLSPHPEMAMPFTVFEVRKALSTSRTHTSPGPDDIPNCVLKLSELANFGHQRPFKNIESVILYTENLEA